MTTQQLADQLVTYCRTGKFTEAYNELFADNASSHEMAGLPNADVYGLDNMRKKSAEWAASVESVNEMTVSDPVVSDGYFAVSMFIDLSKKDGTSDKADEICLYKTANGKITEERFFYSMG
jgi:hypothetical protein